MTDDNNQYDVSDFTDIPSDSTSTVREHGPVVGLEAVLANKEARVKRQREWLRRHGFPLISFSVNMPGPQKLTEASKVIFRQGVKAIERVCQSQGWRIAGEQILLQETGPEGIFSVDIRSAMTLKKQMITIERTHPLGRLMDLDVLDASGQIISRQGQQMPRRKCLLCHDDAVVCARSRRHPLNELLQRIEEIIHEMPDDDQCRC